MIIFLKFIIFLGEAIKNLATPLVVNTVVFWGKYNVLSSLVIVKLYRRNFLDCLA